MVIHKHLHPDLFWTTCGPILMEGEDINNLMIGLCDRIKEDWEKAKKDALLYSFALEEIHRQGDGHYHSHAGPPFLMAISTDAQSGWVLSSKGDITDETLFPIAHALKSMHPDRNSVVGLGDLAERFAKVGSSQARLDFRQTLYRCEKVEVEMNQVSGSARLAETADSPILKKWIVEFFQESLRQKMESATAESWVEEAIVLGRLWVWEKEGATSMLMVNRPTPNGCAISYVFTPEESRRKGFAKALTSEITGKMLQSGKSFVVLFADSDFQGSNSLYLSIGYKQIATGAKYFF